METVLVLATIILPIVLAFVELIKRTVDLPKNLLPLIALIVGLIIGASASPFTDLDIILRMWAGAFAGLAATGLFELGNNRSGTTK
ncbi:holin [Bacillus infantis]|uniref:holin n=1 Tax=Bacillus infantis TaxID=324767 RepID=UPI003CF0CBE2